MPLDLSIVDPHVHFWDPRTTPRAVSVVLKVMGWSPFLMKRLVPKLFPRSMVAFVGKTDYVADAFMPDSLRADAAKLDLAGYIHVQAGWHEKGALAPANETTWVEKIGGEQLLGIVGQAVLDAPELPSLLDAHAAASKRFVGVRDMMAWDNDPGVWNFTPRDRLADERWRKGLALLGDRKLTFDAWCYHPQLPRLAEAAATAPATRIVLCHLGTPIGVGGPFGSYGATAADRERTLAQWRDDFANVAAQPNVYVKISGLLMPIVGWDLHARAEPPTVSEIVDRIGPLVEHALTTFGDDRCMFASNFPMDKVSATYADIFAAFDQLTATRGADMRAKLFRDNALKFYGVARSAR